MFAWDSSHIGYKHFVASMQAVLTCISIRLHKPVKLTSCILPNLLFKCVTYPCKWFSWILSVDNLLFCFMFFFPTDNSSYWEGELQTDHNFDNSPPLVLLPLWPPRTLRWYGTPCNIFKDDRILKNDYNFQKSIIFAPKMHL